MRRSSYVNYYVLCLVCWILLGITGVSTRSHSLVKRFDGIYTGPYFDSNTPTNITAQLGSHAYLPCKVRQLGNKSVSWIRRRDSHILSVDRTMFIPDERFQALFVDASDTWTLQVKYVQARDEGEYECQISTDPKKSHIIKLNIVVPKIEIIGDRDMYVKTGSTVAIRCVIKQSLEGPFYVFWYHEGDRVLDYQLNKIDIQTKRIDHDTISSLLIHKARREDSGNYTCSPSSLDSASVQLHVLNGESYFRIPIIQHSFGSILRQLLGSNPIRSLNATKTDLFKQPYRLFYLKKTSTEFSRLQITDMGNGIGEHPAAIQRGISSAPGGCPTLWWLAGVVTLYSSHGSRLFVLALLILMVLYSKNPSYFAPER